MTVEIGPEDRAVFEQKQARALDVIRNGKVWFLYAVNDDLEGEYIACAPSVDGKSVPADVLARVLLRAVEETARELREALGDV